METSRLKKTAHGFAIAVRVFRILAMVCACICFSAFILLLAFGACGTLVKIYEQDPSALVDVSFSGGNDYIYQLLGLKSLTIEEMYNNGTLNQYCYALAIECLIACIESVVLFVILIFIRKVFLRLEKTENAFARENLVDIRVAFILISILVGLQDLMLGVIVAGIFICLYFIYQHGCKLQENEDTTL